MEHWLSMTGKDGAKIVSSEGRLVCYLPSDNPSMIRDAKIITSAIPLMDVLRRAMLYLNNDGQEPDNIFYEAKALLGEIEKHESKIND